jgi:arginine utilization protein RocB
VTHEDQPGDDRLQTRARDIALTLTGWPSVTGTDGERDFAAKLRGLLATWPCFAAHPEDIHLLPIPDDPPGRANVLALVRGRGSQTVVLSGHFDVVPVDDYGDLAPLAWQPEALREALIAKLEASGSAPQALADLKSGTFLAGRGLLDMKSGLAAGLAVLEAFASNPDRTGNLLLVATPDEEVRSAGMRAAADLLPEFLKRHGLDGRLGINLDALCDNGDGAEGRVAALGCIGKLLLSALVVGRDAHACYPLDGVNAAYLAAEIVTEMEFAPELGEEMGHELASPPTVLAMKDLKSFYNVTTPSRVWTFWNVLTQKRPAKDVLAIAGQTATRAVARAQRRMQERAASLANRPVVSEAWTKIAVMTFDELHGKAQASDPGFDASFLAEAKRIADNVELDLPTQSRLLTEWVFDRAGIDHPAVILGFAAMPYPAIQWPEGERAATLERHIRAACTAMAARTGESIAVNRHLPIIADMSFLGPVDSEDLAFAAAQTPVWGSAISWDVAGRASPGLPMINVGPWGRDYHHWLERVHEGYAFGTLPYLVRDICRRVLAAEEAP